MRRLLSMNHSSRRWLLVALVLTSGLAGGLIGPPKPAAAIYNVGQPIPATATAALVPSATSYVAFSVYSGSNCPGASPTMPNAGAAGVTIPTGSDTTTFNLNTLVMGVPGSYSVMGLLYDRTAAAFVAASNCMNFAVVQGCTNGISSGNKPPLAGGFGTFAFCGGSFTDLLAASGCPAATSVFFYNKPSGTFAPWIPGTSVAAANADIMTTFPGAIPAGTIFVGRCV